MRRCSEASKPRISGRDLVLDREHGALDALAAVAVAAVTQLDGLEGAGRGARGDGRARDGAVVEADLHLDGRVAAGVEDLAGDDGVDAGHRALRCSRTSRDCGSSLSTPAHRDGPPACARGVQGAGLSHHDRAPDRRHRARPVIRPTASPQVSPVLAPTGVAARTGIRSGFTAAGVPRPDDAGPRLLRAGQRLVADPPRPCVHRRRDPGAGLPVAASRGDARLLGRHRRSRRRVGPPVAHRPLRQRDHLRHRRRGRRRRRPGTPDPRGPRPRPPGLAALGALRRRRLLARRAPPLRCAADRRRGGPLRRGAGDRRAAHRLRRAARAAVGVRARRSTSARCDRSSR